MADNIKGPSNRYSVNTEAKAGDKVLFSNLSGFIQDIPKASMVGEVVGVDGDTNVLVNFKFRDGTTKELSVHYLLLK